MRPIEYQFHAAISSVRTPALVGTKVRVGTGALARPGRAKLGSPQRLRQLWTRQILLRAVAIVAVVLIAPTNITAATRPHYGGTLRVMLQLSPAELDLPESAPPADYWDLARTLSLIGDTLVR